MKHRSFVRPADRLSRWALSLSMAMALSAAALVATTAHAGSTTGTVAASATLAPACTLGVNGLAFGSLSALSTTTNTPTTMAVTCTQGTAYSISMNIGTTPGATTHGGVPSRYMTDTGGDLLPYSIYQDSAHATAWGTASFAQTGTGTGTAQTITAYGTAFNPGTLPPGNYTDSVTVTLSY